MEICNQCGLDVNEFKEGVCVDCCRDNQIALDAHNLSYDRWQAMSDTQRAEAIKAA